jgi:ATP-binding cassette subfamily B protein
MTTPAPPLLDVSGVEKSFPGVCALRGVSFALAAGEVLAVVGENGAGKSTLIKLLLRFYDPDEGSVRVGGADLRDLDPAALRSRIGVLFQDYASYELSVRENVVMGRPDGQVHDDDRVMEALRDARSEWLLKKMPKGLDSKVGRLFEGGHDLSGGEWQRLALARIMYRDADIWILDEPTSSLDPEAEAAIFAELKENLKGRIGIVISHRFSTVRIADRIAVIGDGRITELGTHEELLRAGGRYAELFELQAAGYR